MYNLVVIPVEYFESSEIWNQWKIENKVKRKSFFCRKNSVSNPMSTVSWLQFLGGLGLGLSLSYIMSQFQQKVSEKEEENDNIDDSDEWEDETDSDGGKYINY